VRITILLALFAGVILMAGYYQLEEEIYMSGVAEFKLRNF
jgi:hypothetical protein